MTAPFGVPAATDQPRGASWAQRVLRLTAALLLGLILLQATLAGHLLSGHSQARAMHATIGTEVITWLALIQLLTAIWYRIGTRGPRWPAVLSGAFLGVVALQINWGFGGRLALHLPVGTALFAAQLMLVLPLRAPRGRVSSTEARDVGA